MRQGSVVGMSRARWALHVSYFFLMQGGLVRMIFNGPSDFRDFVDERSAAPNMIYLCIHVIYAVLALYKLNETIRSLRRLIMPVILVIFCFVSSLWSSNFPVSIVQSSFLALQIIACCYIFSDLKYDEFLQTVSEACFIGVVVSISLALLLPSYGTMTYVSPGSWQGIFTHKNSLGRFAVFSLIVLLSVGHIWKRRWLRNAGVILSILLVIGSESATAIIALTTVSIALLAISSKKASSTFLLLLIAFGPISVALISLYGINIPSLVLSSLDKSPTFSGRTTVWEQAYSYILSRPFTGFGLGGFWNTEFAATLRLREGWHVPHAHNGVLEVGLQLGFPGIIMLLAVVASASRAAWRMRWRLENRFALFPLLAIVHALIYGVGEAFYLRPNTFVQITLYALILYGGRHQFVPSRNYNKTHITPSPVERTPF